VSIYPWIKDRFFGAPVDGWQWPEGYAGKEIWQELSFTSLTGAKMAGLYGPAATEAPKGNIVCAHPMKSAAKGFYLKSGMADALREEGYNVLLFDFNGFGDSENIDFEWPGDILAAGRELKKLSPSLPQGLLGVSMGGAMGICACSNPDHDFDVVVAEGAFTSLEEFWVHFPTRYYVIKVTSLFVPKSETNKMKAIHHAPCLKKLKGILFIHGEEDHLSPPDMGHRFNDMSPIPSELWIVPGAGHIQCVDAAPEAYRERVLDFFNRHLEAE